MELYRPVKPEDGGSPFEQAVANRLPSVIGGQRESSSGVPEVLANVIHQLLPGAHGSSETITTTCGNAWRPIGNSKIILEVLVDSKALWLDCGQTGPPALEPVQIVYDKILGQNPVSPGRREHGPEE